MSVSIVRKIFGILIILALLLPFTSAQAGQPADAPDPRDERGPSIPSEPLPTDRIIVKFKPSAEAATQNTEEREQLMNALSQTAGEPLSYFRQMSGGAHVISLREKQPYDRALAVAEKLMERVDIEYAEPDRILEHTLVPNDPLYAQQWHYFGTYGINLPAAWEITTGSTSVVVAVLDTGITNHVDLSGKTVPGYDFIADPFVANDGGGRDSNPSDPGDWTLSGECYPGSPARNSSWHGTHVAGTVGANTNNNIGVAGVSWGSKILPVRVLGKCGGYLSDIADGMRWAAGLPVSGVPDNANPAKVLNLSLGGPGACDISTQSAIDAVLAAGSTVVVSAGNSAANAAGYSPANCNGVITVGATDEDGFLAGYSNYGSTLEISAPGGDFNWDTGILSTLNAGTTTPGADNYVAYQGTSMAAPHVSGVISLMLSVTPTLTPGQVLEILQNTAKDFGSSWCNTTTNCGAGIVDAYAAVKTAQFYNWSGGAMITSSQPVVAVARPHVGAEVASYNAFSSGSLTSYVPMLFKQAFGGSYNSALYVQNLHSSSSASISISYYTSTGSLTCTVTDTLAARSSKGYWLPSVGCLPAGWVGGAVVTSTQNIVTVSRSHVGSEVMTYDGFSSGSAVSYLPMLFKNAFGGTYNAAFYIQNINSSNTATVTIKYYDETGNLSCTTSDTILPLASKGYWLPGVTCLPGSWVGGVEVTSSQPVVTVARVHVGSQVTTYNGSSGSGTTFSYLPMLFKNAFSGGSYKAAVYVQNLNSSLTANISMQYYDNAGNLVCTVTDTLLPKASKGYWLPSLGCLPDGWVGSVVITSSQNIFAVARAHVGTQITTYSGFSATNTTAYLPMLFKDAFGGSYDSAVYIHNTHTSNSASITVNFYNANGVLSCTKTDSIAPRATLGYWLPSITTCNP